MDSSQPTEVYLLTDSQCHLTQTNPGFPTGTSSSQYNYGSFVPRQWRQVTHLNRNPRGLARSCKPCSPPFFIFLQQLSYSLRMRSCAFVSRVHVLLPRVSCLESSCCSSAQQSLLSRGSDGPADWRSMDESTPRTVVIHKAEEVRPSG